MANKPMLKINCTGKSLEIELDVTGAQRISRSIFKTEPALFRLLNQTYPGLSLKGEKLARLTDYEELKVGREPFETWSDFVVGRDMWEPAPNARRVTEYKRYELVGAISRISYPNDFEFLVQRKFESLSIPYDDVSTHVSNIQDLLNFNEFGLPIYLGSRTDSERQDILEESSQTLAGYIEGYKTKLDGKVSRIQAGLERAREELKAQANPEDFAGQIRKDRCVLDRQMKRQSQLAELLLKVAKYKSKIIK